ncbi:hypothetical protein [Psychrobacter sp. JCM 18900]|uniref:hypothetical protein n=1 Tax=Psychrobacter sp. JCM 18900 TaxID=1298608 RepID=UPI000431FBE2|nr:hypothetical protein [Psychrobacter sp. JCM 18900]GAF54203.1 hypothetical protein JCM18900_12826 [Psychrobacter sp. JCM 18900]
MMLILGYYLTGQKNTQPKKRVGILGGGTAGSTIAIRLAALGLETYLFEKKKIPH